MFLPISSKKRVSERKLRRAALQSFHAVLAAERDMHTTLFTFEMTQHPELVAAWENDALPEMLDAAARRTLDGQKQALREMLLQMIREREVATQFLFEMDVPHDALERLRDDDEREVLIRHLYRAKYRLGALADYAREWGKSAIMLDAGIYVIRDISASLLKDARPDDWFDYYVDAYSRFVFHRNEAALAVEKGRDYPMAPLVRAYEKLLVDAESGIRDLQDFAYSPLDFERRVMTKKGRETPGAWDDADADTPGRPSVYMGD